nr:MAG TPA: hypothetical protein [Caudoviricetes sp.]
MEGDTVRVTVEGSLFFTESLKIRFFILKFWKRSKKRK